MGWLIYNDRVSDPQAECDRIVTWDADCSTGQVIKSSIVGSTYYAAHKKTDKATGKSTTLAVVLLIQRSPFGYKDMDETMGPSESDCPRFILEALDPLPPRDPQTCNTCDGTGKLHGEGVRAEKQGATCYACDGRGDRDRYDHRLSTSARSSPT